MRYLGLSGPIAVAHRGGGLENVENSLSAFQHAMNLGYQVLETDVHASADGVLVVMHDPDLTKTCGQPVQIAENSWSFLSTLRMNNGDRLLRLEELVEAAPAPIRLNIDPKSDAAVQPLSRLLTQHPDLVTRVCLGSFSAQRLKALRAAHPEIPTSLGASEIAQFFLACKLRVRTRLPSSVVALQIPERRKGVQLVSQQFINFAHDMGVDVHVWTVNTEDDMHRLLDLGVDAIITDRPTTLKQVLVERGSWRPNQP